MRILLASLTVLFLAACQETVPEPIEPLQFTGSGYTLNVAHIDVIQDYESTKEPPNVEYLSDVTPAQAVKKWAGQKLTAAGHDNSLEVDVTDASIVLTELPKQKSGIEGILTTEQTEKLDGKLSVTLKIYSPLHTLPIAHMDVSATASTTLPQNAAPIDRKRACHQLTVEMMKTLEPQIDENMHRYFIGYLL